MATPTHLQIADYQEYWIAAKTILSQELKVCKYLDQHHTRHFVPMKARIVVNGAGERVRQLMPVVHNLIFIQLDRSADEVKRILKECPYPTLVYTQHDHPEQWCMIPGHDMTDLRMMCDASFCEPQFVDSREYELREGHRVRIVHGPLCGLRGKLIRKSKKYYFVKTFDGFGVMVSVSRWCCEPDVDAEQPEVNQQLF